MLYYKDYGVGTCEPVYFGFLEYGDLALKRVGIVHVMCAFVHVMCAFVHVMCAFVHVMCACVHVMCAFVHVMCAFVHVICAFSRMGEERGGV